MKNLIVLIAVFLLLPGIASAQAIKIFVDFNESTTIQETNGRPSVMKPSTLSSTDKQAVLDIIKNRFERAVGAGGVSVQEGSSGGIDGLLIVVSGGIGQGDVLEDVHQNLSLGVLYEGMFTKLGVAQTQLPHVLGEAAARMAAYLLVLYATEGVYDIMSIHAVDKWTITDNHFFSADQSAELKGALLDLPVPREEPGPVESVINDIYPVTDTVIKIDRLIDWDFSVSPYNYQLGIKSTKGEFLPFNIDPLTHSGIISLPLRNSTELYVKAPDGTITSTSSADISYADSYLFPLLNKEVMKQLYANVIGAKLFLSQIGLGLTANSGFNATPAIPKNAPKGVASREEHITKNFAVDISAEAVYATLSSSTKNSGSVDGWYPPLGTYVIGGVLQIVKTDSGFGTLFYQAIYKVLLDDGEVVELIIRGTENKSSINVSILPTRTIAAPKNLDQHQSVDKLVGDPFILGGNRVYSLDTVLNIWVVDSAGLNFASVYDIDLDHNQTLYAATSDGFYVQPKSAAWHKTSFYDASNHSSNVYTIFVDRRNRLHLVGTYGLLWISTDGGNSFALDTAGLRNQLGFGVYQISKFGEDALGNIYAIPDPTARFQPGIFQQGPGGGAWKLIAQSIVAEAHDQTTQGIFQSITGDDSTSLALATSFGNYVSTDHGVTWNPDKLELPAESFYAIAKAGNNQLFVGTDLGIYSGNYHGTNWPKRFPMSGFMTSQHIAIFGGAIAIPQNDLFIDASGNLYTLGSTLTGFNNFQSKIATSTDGGVTWTEDSAGIAQIKRSGRYFVDAQGRQFIVTAASGVAMKIYTKPSGGVWALDQAGFVPRPLADQEFPSAFGSFDASTTYLSTASNSGNTVWKYHAGQWTVDSAGLMGAQVFSFAAGKNGDMFSGTDNGILHLSGGQWSQIPLPKDIPSGAFTLHVSADASGALFCAFEKTHYFGLLGSGVYFTKDLGQHWTSCNIGNKMQINALYSYGDTTYLLTGQGMFALTSRVWSTAHVAEGPVINFDTLAVNTTASKTITITNFGNDTLRVSNITSTGAYTVMPGPLVAAPKGIFQRQVQFTPTSAGANSGMAVITSNSEHGTDTVFFDGAGTTTGAVKGSGSLGFALDQNYPNPFNSTTTITYSVAERGSVSLTVTDILGREVGILVSEVQDAGKHQVTFNAKSLGNSVYSYTLKSGNNTATRQMILLK